MKTIKFFIALLISFLPSLVFAGTAYYVDCSAASDGNGTYGNPWNNIVSVNNHNFDTGDDVYFKAGTTCIMSAALNVDWNGTEGDPATIGCYDGEGDFDCSGARPILDGTSSVPNTDSGLIYKTNGQYVTIDYLKVYRSGWSGILIKADNTTVQSCYVSYNERHGIFVKGSNAFIDNSIITQNGQINNPTQSAWMGALVLTGQGSVVTGGTVSRNKLFNNYTTEGLSINRKADYTTVENNVIYDNKSVMSIYIDTSKNVTVRYNLAYNSSNVGSWRRGNGISINNEPYPFGCYTGSHKIYSNLIAGATSGINIGADLSGCYQNDSLYYNNTIVDSTEYNFRFWTSGLPGSGNVIKNNISWTISVGSAHANNYNPSGYTWSHNNFDDSVSGNAATNAVIGDPALSKSSGWQTMTAGAVDGTEFALLYTSSAIGAADSTIGAAYNDMIDQTNVDFTASPISVSLLDQDLYGDWEIGAMVYPLAVDTDSVDPSDGSTGVSLTKSVTWDYATFIDDADIWVTQGLCSAIDGCAGAPDSDDDADKTFDMTAIINGQENTDFCIGIKANDGVNQGDCQEFDFITTDVDPITPPLNFGIHGMKQSANAGGMVQSNNAGSIIGN